MAWREAPAPLSVPESDRQEVVQQKPPSLWRFPQIPTIPLPRWLVTYSTEHRRAPLEPGRKRTGGRPRSRQTEIEKNEFPFAVTT